MGLGNICLWFRRVVATEGRRAQKQRITSRCGRHAGEVKTILTWSSDIWEHSFTKCDSLKSHLPPMEEKRPLRQQPEIIISGRSSFWL
jgi:hypothetical protein